MATVLLQSAGGVIGGAIGGPVGAMLGRAIGGAVGSVVDQTLIAALSPAARREGPRLTSVDITGSVEGAPVARLVGRSRLAGQMIWATRFHEVAETGGGGKGLGGPSSTAYRYLANFAVALCEGPVARIGRIWADGRELDHDYPAGWVTIRKYLGTEDQEADSLIEAKEGPGNAPAYRGIAYVVFEAMDLTTFGNRMPVITAEVFRAVGDLEPLVEAVAMIPGSTEFGYDPLTLGRATGPGTYATENRNTLVAPSDLLASLDTLEALAPNCGSVNLVVAWFGTDLRCGHCEIKPKVESRNKVTVYYGHPYPWVVAGLNRLTADLVSEVSPGVPAYGGSPNDASVIACIRELKARGYRVLLYPFIMMDIEQGNTLPNPYSNNAAQTGQPAWSWRGRITCSPAPGYTGSPDKSGAVASQVADFVGSATAAHFAASSGVTVAYSGPAEWRYRRFILHMAKLAQLAGGVDAFTIGSEMVGMTTVRSSSSAYPFVSALIDLAGEVRAILGAATRLGYAADWSEYHSHRPADGSGDVYFHLDPLWADETIDFIGIDNYLPLADWRDGSEHLDYSSTGPTTVYDLGYLKANVEGGEYFDWFYASAADRDSQTRTPITDGAYGKPWVFRNKDVRSWWANQHVNRPGGTEAGPATAWVPESKPIWFTEIGCPAVDKGANQPNVFFDPKSSESFLPHYSSGARDDAMQRAFLQAALEYWGDNANNPLSGVYAGRMIDTSWTAVWAWDARPVPSFPQDEATWADAANFELGHWISGRLGAAPARETIRAILAGSGLSDHAVEPMAGVVDAVVIDRTLSPRGVLEAILPAFCAYAVESGGLVRFRSRLGEPVGRDLGCDDLAEAGPGAGAGPGVGAGEEGVLLVRTLDQASERPDVVRIGYGDPSGDDQPASAEAMRPGMSGTGKAGRIVQVALPAVMPASRAGAIAEMLLNDAWAGRETVEFALPPSLLDLDPGDVVRIEGAGAGTWRIAEIADGEARRVRAARTEASLFAAPVMPSRPRPPAPVPASGMPEAVFLDGPLLQDGDIAHAGYIAAHLAPWPGGVAFWRSPTDSGFVPDTVLGRRAAVGTTVYGFWSGPVWRWDRVNDLWVDLVSGSLASAGPLQVFGGANALAVENAEGEWEILQFATAELVAAGRYKLSNLLRGQRGSAHAMRDPVAAGARVLVLDPAVRQPALSAGDVGLPLTWRVGPANADVSEPSYLEATVTMTGRGLRPLPPVHLRGRRNHASGDWSLCWIRQTRIGGDAWDRTEVPLGEASEAYRLEILDPGDDSVVRTVAVTSPGYLYAAAQQTADFGSTVWNVKIRVAQLSEAFGPGIPAVATVWDH